MFVLGVVIMDMGIFLLNSVSPTVWACLVVKAPLVTAGYHVMDLPMVPAAVPR
jgi:hypothetical protein